MWRKILFAVVVLTFAFAILLLSIFRTAAVRYEVKDNPNSPNTGIPENNGKVVDYYLPYPGNVLPDSPFWEVKAIRDKIWLSITTNPTRKAELMLLFADKRLGSAKELFDKGNINEGITTLSKAEKYLEESLAQEKKNRSIGLDTAEFLIRLSKASLKHYEVMEEIKAMVADDVKPVVISFEVYPQKIFEQSRNSLLETGITPPENPFDW